jgi:glutamyl-tRNA synthetase
MPDGNEFFFYEDVEREFSLDRVTTSGPVFDLVKLTAINGKHIRMLSDEELLSRLLKHDAEYGGELQRLDPAKLAAVIPVVKDRLTRLGEFLELTGYIFGPPPEYDAALLVPKKLDAAQAREALSRTRALLASLAAPWTHDEWEAGIRAIAEELGLKAGDVFMALRVAVSGSTTSLPLFESMEIIGKEQSLERVDAALAKLG